MAISLPFLIYPGYEIGASGQRNRAAKPGSAAGEGVILLSGHGNPKQEKSQYNQSVGE
ncbi:hypothetical protein ACCS71_14040 [Rhizobium ruizarguesonis]